MGGGKADLIEYGDEFFDVPFSRDVQKTIEYIDAQILRGEYATKNQLLAVSRNICKSADAVDACSKSARVDIAATVDLAESKKRKVDSASIVKIELRSLLKDGLWIG